MLTSMYRAGPWVLQSVSGRTLWHVPQVKVALYSSGFSCLSPHFLLHNLLSLPAELSSALAVPLHVCCAVTHMLNVLPLLTAFCSPDCLGSTYVMMPGKY